MFDTRKKYLARVFITYCTQVRQKRFQMVQPLASPPEVKKLSGVRPNVRKIAPT